MTTTYGYKAMELDMTCRGFQFEVEKTYKVDNDKPLELCSDSGFHFCLNFEDVFNYYDWHSSRVFKIKTESGVVTEKDKSITKEITILEEIALEKMDLKQFQNRETKLFVINNLSDRNLIFNTFKNDEDLGVRLAVVKKLSDEKLIFDTFKDDEDWAVRFLVVKKLSDEKLIFNTFKDDEDLDVRLAVVNKLSDEKLIYDTFKDDKSWIVRRTVINKLSNEKLISYFKDDEDEDVRKAVIKKLSDENLIYDTFKDDKHWLVRLAAVKKLSDKKLLAYFKNDSDSDIRCLVNSKLK